MSPRADRGVLVAVATRCTSEDRSAVRHATDANDSLEEHLIFFVRMEKPSVCSVYLVHYYLGPRIVASRIGSL